MMSIVFLGVIILVTDPTPSDDRPPLGLAAKPIFDILAGWEVQGTRDDAIRALEAAGYQYRGESGIPGRDFFRRGDPRQYHVHLTREGSTFWDDHLTFRDYLRAKRDVAESYAALKRDLAARYPTERERYIDGKTEFVRATLARARLEHDARCGAQS